MTTPPTVPAAAFCLRLLRHATLYLELGGWRLLVDPMLSAAGALDPVRPAPNTRQFPLVALPLGETELAHLLAHTDAVLLTHLHRDHWDEAARARLPRTQRLFCQPADLATLQAQGFTQVQAVAQEVSWGTLTLTRTGSQHGLGALGARMGPVSGFVLRTARHCLYLAGDTVWCPEVAAALARYRPGIIVLNTGGAQFSEGDPITMTTADVAQVLAAAPGATVLAVHLEAVNHCRLSRRQLAEELQFYPGHDRCRLPADGQTYCF